MFDEAFFVNRWTPSKQTVPRGQGFGPSLQQLRALKTLPRKEKYFLQDVSVYEIPVVPMFVASHGVEQSWSADKTERVIRTLISKGFLKQFPSGHIQVSKFIRSLLLRQLKQHR